MKSFVPTVAHITVLMSLLGMLAVEAPAESPQKVSGIDKSLFGDDVGPGENFYRYANEKWLQTTKIPADKSNYGIFTVLADRTNEQVRELIEAASAEAASAGTPAQQVGELYRTAMDLETRNAAGIRPIEALLKSVNAIDSPAALAKSLALLTRHGVYGPFAPYVSVDARDSDRYAVSLTQSGLSLPDRDYYLNDDDRYVQLREQLKQYVADMLGFVEHPSPQQAAERILAIETALAEAQWERQENRDPIKTYNKLTQEEIAQLVESFEWSKYATDAGIAEQPALIVRQPSYFSVAGGMLQETSLEDWQDYLRFRVVDAYATDLSEAMERRHFEFHDTAVSGVSEQEPLWKRSVAVVNNVVGELVGQLYVDKHFQPDAKQRMDELIKNLERAFESRIKTRDWMGEGTKKQALRKLGLVTDKIGYPEVWKDYTKLNIAPGPLAANVLAAANFETDRELAKLDGPVDRNEWGMTPQTVNAYYSPTKNEIVFPAAILQPPFFNMAADDAANYGAIGAVIGHELSHGFDDKGSQYDGKGNLRKWWTDSDRDEFDSRTAGLVTQYDAFQPIDDMHVNGELTLGENIGDLGGLSVAYEAYRLSLGGEEPAVIDGLTGDQRFFLGWAQIWRRLYQPEELRRRLIVDPHSPSEYRVNGIVRNMDAWYEAFGIQPDDALYLAPDQRIRLW